MEWWDDFGLVLSIFHCWWVLYFCICFSFSMLIHLMKRVRWKWWRWWWSETCLQSIVNMSENDWWWVWLSFLCCGCYVSQYMSIIWSPLSVYSSVSRGDGDPCSNDLGPGRLAEVFFFDGGVKIGWPKRKEDVVRPIKEWNKRGRVWLTMLMLLMHSWHDSGRTSCEKRNSRIGFY